MNGIGVAAVLDAKNPKPKKRKKKEVINIEEAVINVVSKSVTFINSYNVI